AARASEQETTELERRSSLGIMGPPGQGAGTGCSPEERDCDESGRLRRGGTPRVLSSTRSPARFLSREGGRGPSCGPKKNAGPARSCERGPKRDGASLISGNVVRDARADVRDRAAHAVLLVPRELEQAVVVRVVHEVVDRVRVAARVRIRA